MADFFNTSKSLPHQYKVWDRQWSASALIQLDVRRIAAKRDADNDISRMLQCILLEIHPALIYLSIDKFAEASS
jgi:hypothetical protein